MSKPRDRIVAAGIGPPSSFSVQERLELFEVLDEIHSNLEEATEKIKELSKDLERVQRKCADLEREIHDLRKMQAN